MTTAEMEREIEKLDVGWIWLRDVSRDSRDRHIELLNPNDPHREELKAVIMGTYDDVLRKILMVFQARRK